MDLAVLQMIIFMLIGILIVAIIITLIYNASIRSQSPQRKEPADYLYQPKPSLMTKHELTFYKELVPIAREKNMLVLPKIRLSEVIEPVDKPDNHWANALSAISNKHVDFVICDAKQIKYTLAVMLDSPIDSDSLGQTVNPDVHIVGDSIKSAGLPVLYAHQTDDLAEKIEQFLNV